MPKLARFSLTWHLGIRIIMEVGAIPAKTKEEEKATDINGKD
jgi:hypothetical protein